MSELLTPKEAAAWLGITVDTLADLARRGEIRATKVGRLRRYREEWLVSYDGDGEAGDGVTMYRTVREALLAVEEAKRAFNAAQTAAQAADYRMREAFSELGDAVWRLNYAVEHPNESAAEDAREASGVADG